MQRIVITGATSMIGIALIHAALQDDEIITIYAVVRPHSSNISRIPKDDRIRVVEKKVSDYLDLDADICTSCDAFYHLAWDGTGAERDRDLKTQSENILYAIDALRVAKKLGCRIFIGAGSQAEYGPQDVDAISPETPVRPVTGYGVAKYAAGKIVSLEAERLGIDCIWVRIFSVYGIYDQETSMISQSLTKMLNGETVRFTPAQQQWDYLFNEDAGKAFFMIGQQSSGNKIYCLGSGTSDILENYIYSMRDAVDPDLPVLIGSIPYGSNQVMKLCADITSLTQDTGWKPETEFTEGIYKTMLYKKMKISGGGGGRLRISYTQHCVVTLGGAYAA